MADVEGLIAEIRSEMAEQIAAMQGQLASAMSEIASMRQDMEKPTQTPTTQAQEQAQKGQSSEEWRGAMDSLNTNVTQQMLTLQANLTQFQGTMSTELTGLSVMMGTNVGHTEDLNRAQTSRTTGVKEKLQTDEGVARASEDSTMNAKLTGAENAIVEMRLEGLEAAVYVDSIDATMITGCPDFSL